MRVERKWGQPVKAEPRKVRNWATGGTITSITSEGKEQRRKFAYDSAEAITQEAVRMINESGIPVARLTREGGLGASTINNWCTGKTRRANTSTLIAALRPLGYGIGIIKE